MVLFAYLDAMEGWLLELAGRCLGQWGRVWWLGIEGILLIYWVL